jgi:hypothetical protein
VGDPERQPGPAPEADPIERALAAGAGGAPDYGLAVRLHACDACGIRFAVAAAAPGDADPCPLCGGPSRDAGALAGTGPLRAAPFAVSQARADALFRRWLGRLRLRPPAWTRQARTRGPRGVFLPLWTVDATLRSRWTARAAGPAPVGAAPRTWKPVAGERVDRVSGAWPALRLPAHSPGEAALHDDGGLVPWAPEYLAGWTAVLPSSAPGDAWRAIRAALVERVRGRCADDVPGELHRDLRVETAVEVADVAPGLVPVYVAAVPWAGRVHRFVVDGRTGRVEGDAPYSPGKVAGLLVAGVLAATALGALIARDEPPPPAAAATPAAP